MVLKTVSTLGATGGGGTVTAVTGSGNIASSGGATPNITFTGTLPVANGGTNSTATPTAGGAGYGTGTAHAYTAAGTSGQPLISAGAGAPAFGNLGTGAGGTGLTSFTANGVVYASSSSALATGSALVFDGTNLGVGTSSPATKLEVSVASSDATLNQEVLRVSTTGRSAAGGTAGRSAVISFYDSANATLTGAIGGFRTNSNIDFSGGLKFFYNGASASSGVSTLSEGMRLDSSGNFGIGTSSPNGTLTINKPNTTNGTVFLNGATTTPDFARIKNTGADFVWGIESSTGGSIVTGSSAYAGVLYTVNSTSLQLGTNGSVKATLDSSGNLGIGTTPNASAILDAQSTTKGVRMPNMTTTQKNAISSPAAGLMVFDTTLAKLCVYSGSAWQTITSV